MEIVLTYNIPIPILNISNCTGHSKKGLDCLTDEPHQDWFDRTDHDYMQSLYELSPYLEDILLGIFQGLFVKNY